MTDVIEQQHKELLYPCVRVRAHNAGGSGTIIYSKANGEDYETYLLTNHHVVDSCIKTEKKWSPLLQRDVKTDIRSTVDVEFFRYKWHSRAVGATLIQSDVMAYDKEQDIALLKLRDPAQVPNVAKLYPRGKESKLHVFTPVYAVGAALGHPPIPTSGQITSFGDEIDNYEYWLTDSQIIYGNSGGAVFLQDTHEFIGIPARISVHMSGFSADTITHMGFFIPITRVYNFLEEQCFHFIFDPSVTSKECEEMRRKKREEEEKKMAKSDDAVEDE